MKLLWVKLLASVLLLVIATVAGLGYYGYTKFKTPSHLAAEKILSIPRGFGTQAIAEMLNREGIISDSYVFMAASRLILPEQTLKAGEYQFAPTMTMQDVIIQIKEGRIYKRQFTIPEGLTSFEILERLRSVPDLQVVEVPAPVEGSLLPDTYQYSKGQSSTNAVYQMQEAMRGLLAKEWPLRDPDVPLMTEQQVLTLASIVEKETGVASERSRIAGVFINRLKRGIPLQSDPTVIYALTNGRPKSDGQGPLGRRLLLKDLEIDSPFNTYKNAGLPPSPICNPGKDAILAVLHPEKHDFLFFVADGSGGHVFASSLAEHNRNVASWRKTRKAAENQVVPAP